MIDHPVSVGNAVGDKHLVTIIVAIAGEAHSHKPSAIFRNDGDETIRWWSPFKDVSGQSDRAASRPDLGSPVSYNMNVMVLCSWPDMESKLLEGINDSITHLQNSAI